VHSVKPAPSSPVLNEPISSRRHLARVHRPLDDLDQIKRRYGTTLNDVVLGVASGAIRRLFERQGEIPVRLKAMVPVSLRDRGGATELGNRISFVFVDLPCDEPDAMRRLREVHLSMSSRKHGGEPAGADFILKAFGHAPRTVRRVVSRMIASPRSFNLVVSNIPGPRVPMFMCGCRLHDAYPVVPLSARHALSVGMTTIGEHACFGLYADAETLPDSDALAHDLDAAIDELRATTEPTRPGPGRFRRPPAPVPTA
jgi:WS/DGAT/MGAT family acyltransferase